MTNSDYVVVGAGVAGLCLARELLQRGAAVTLLDGGGIGSGTSRVAAGMLAPLVEARLVERDLLDLGVAALRAWRDFARHLTEETGIDLGYRQEGTLIVGIEPDHQRTIDHVAEEYRALGLAIDPVGYQEIRELEPMLSPTVTGGLRAPDDHQVDNRALLRALEGSVRSHPKATLREGIRVRRIESTRSGTVRLRTSDADILADRVVLAAGAETRRIEGIPDYLRRALRPVKGEILRLGQPAGPLLSRVVRTPEVYFVPKGDGTLVVGASSEERGFEPQVRVGPLFELLRSAWETLPGVWELPILEQSVGFRPATLDHAPVIGPVGNGPVWILGGFYRHGILLAPFVAEEFAPYLEECVQKKQSGRDDEPDTESEPDLPRSLARFHPGRFNRRPAQR